MSTWSLTATGEIPLAADGSVDEAAEREICDWLRECLAADGMGTVLARFDGSKVVEESLGGDVVTDPDAEPVDPNTPPPLSANKATWYVWAKESGHDVPADPRDITVPQLQALAGT